jgi:hypothetical protein
VALPAGLQPNPPASQPASPSPSPHGSLMSLASLCPPHPPHTHAQVANHDGVDLGASFDSGPGYYYDDVGRGTLTRLVLDLGSGAAHLHRLMHRACEFPSVAPAGKAEPCECMCVCGCGLMRVASSAAMGEGHGVRKQCMPVQWRPPAVRVERRVWPAFLTPCKPAIPLFRSDGSAPLACVLGWQPL